MLQKVAKRFSIHAGKKMRWFWIGSEAISRLTCMFSTAVHSTWQKPPLATTAPRLDRGPPSSSTSLVYSSSSSTRVTLLLHQRDPTWPPEGARTAVGGHQRPTKANKGQRRPTLEHHQQSHPSLQYYRDTTINEYSLKLFDSIVLLKIVPQLFLDWIGAKRMTLSRAHVTSLLYPSWPSI